MHIATIDRIEMIPSSEPGLELRQFGSRSAALFMLGLAVPASVALLSPFVLIGYHPEVISAVVERPLSAALVFGGLLAAAALLYSCLSAGIVRLSRSGRVTVRNGMITGVDSGLFGTKTWSKPLASYCGVAHHIRSSVNGTRHEIVLVNARREYDVLLAVSAGSPEVSASDVAASLGLQEIEARALYRRQRSEPIAADDREASTLAAA